jgi:hypothetical protein
MTERDMGTYTYTMKSGTALVMGSPVEGVKGNSHVTAKDDCEGQVSI